MLTEDGRERAPFGEPEPARPPRRPRRGYPRGMNPVRLRRFAASFVLASALASPLGATWSIVLVNRATGEVAVGSATCLTNLDLRRTVPAIVVGRGAGAAQSLVDSFARNRQRMVAGFLAGTTPQAILDDILTNGPGSPFVRQFGIVSMDGAPVTYSGTSNGAAAGGVVGTVGDLSYAIQGNVLTGVEVVLAAEQAILLEDGDLGQKLLAGMEAARSLGGDGRCSCSGADPTGCGAPPPSFQKSAHVGFLILARIGDTDGTCNQGGCANGDYYLNLNQITVPADNDPVLKLASFYRLWRADRRGRPDHILSTSTSSAASVPADGLTRATFTVRLVDIEGVPLDAGGADVVVTGVQGGLVTIGDVVDHDDGTYSFEVTAGTSPGTESFVVTAEDDLVQATLYPFSSLRIDPVTTLHAGRDELSISAGGEVPLTLNVPSAPGRPYVILMSASGTDPGTLVGTVRFPLNFDALTLRSLRHAGSTRFPGTIGVLAGDGHGEAAFRVPPGLLVNHVDGRFDCSALVASAPVTVTNAVGFDLVHGAATP